MPMGDQEAVEGRTAVRPDGAGGVVRRSTENCMTLRSRRGGTQLVMWLRVKSGAGEGYLPGGCMIHIPGVQPSRLRCV
jgi:hypothetical protein